MYDFEDKYYKMGYNLICGIDEAGRGPLAGPVCAAAVILPADCRIAGINDSKKLSEKKRNELFPIIMEKAMAVGVGLIGAEEIDEINILQATFRAMEQAVSKLSVTPDIVLVDGNRLPKLSMKMVSIIGGDGKSGSIAAASIVAKVTRDRLMAEYDKAFPEYGFAKHKGYGTAEHIKSIGEYGICAIHRRSFIKADWQM